MKLLRLKTENVQRIKLVEIKPDGNLIVIGGKNGQGKSSEIDSIQYLFGGKKLFSQRPVRDGAKEAIIEGETEDFVVRRTIRPNGNTEVVVTAKDGSTISSPQKLFDKLTSKLTHDPLAFANMDSKSQTEIIKSLIPFDFTGNEKLRESYYNERTFVNRELKKKEAENSANPYDPNIPVDELQLDESELDAAISRKSAQVQLESTIKRGKEKIATIEKQIAELIAEKEKIVSWLAKNEPLLAEFGNVDEETSRLSLKMAENREKNIRIRKNREAKLIFTEMKTIEAKSNELTKEVDRLDREKLAAIESASLPVAGLSFSDDTGVCFQGIPFAQLSGAEKLKVSLAMGIAINPTLRILLIRDGSLLDEDNLKIVADMAKQHDMQVWIERVGKGEECSVIIEDGLVIENRTQQQQEVAA